MLKRSGHGWEIEMIKSPSTEERNENSLDSGGIKDAMEDNNITKTTVDFSIMKQSFKMTISLKMRYFLLLTMMSATLQLKLK